MVYFRSLHKNMAPSLKNFFRVQLSWAWNFLANKYKNATNGWRFHIY